MAENTPPRLSRRGFFIGAASVGAVTAGAVVMPIVRQDTPEASAAKPAPTRGGGYQVSEHVKRYYKTTLV